MAHPSIPRGITTGDVAPSIHPPPAPPITPITPAIAYSLVVRRHSYLFGVYRSTVFLTGLGPRYDS